MIELECQRWASKGINIRYQIRENRGGYKAGALKEGLKRSYVKHCEYVVIFDADFRPEPDFLRRAIPFLIHNPEIALVQARWRFGKPSKTQRYWSIFCPLITVHLIGFYYLWYLYYKVSVLFALSLLVYNKYLDFHSFYFFFVTF